MSRSWHFCALTGVKATLLAKLRFYWLAVPFRIVEMKVRLYEIVDGEVILSIIKARTTSNDLFELDHRVDRAHENDVADIAGVHAGRDGPAAHEYWIKTRAALEGGL